MEKNNDKKYKYGKLPKRKTYIDFFNNELSIEEQEEVYCSTCTFMTNFLMCNLNDINSVDVDEIKLSLFEVLAIRYKDNFEKINSSDYIFLHRRLSRICDKANSEHKDPKTVLMDIDVDTILDVFAQEDEYTLKKEIEAYESKDFVKRLLLDSKLLDREKEIIEALFLRPSSKGGRTHKQLAYDFEVTRIRVGQIKDNGIKKMQKRAAFYELMGRR